MVDGAVTNHELRTLWLVLKGTCYDKAWSMVGSAADNVDDLGTDHRKNFTLSTAENIDGVDRVHVEIETAF